MTELPQLRTKDKVLQLVAAHGVPVHDVDELRDLWGPFPPHARELTRVLWDLQKQGEIKFNEIKAGRDSLLTRIRLSRGIQTTAFRANESRGRHPVGKDLTDPMSHSHIAQGGPIEKIRLENPRKETPVVETYVPHGPKPKEGSSWTEYVGKVKPDRVRPILPLIEAGIDRPIGLQRELGYSSPRITTLVTRGEQLGWLTKQRVGVDDGLRPGVKLTLTDEGSRLAAETFIDERSDAQKTRRKRKEADVPRKEVDVMPADTPTQYPQADTPVEYADPTAGDFVLETSSDGQQIVTPEAPAATMNTATWPRIIDVVELERYPLISDLMSKEERVAAYEAAAKLLEGFDADLALSLLEKIQLTPLESEVIAFVRSLR